MKKNKGVRGLILIGLVSLIPLVALAQSSGNPIGGIVTFGTIIRTFTDSIVRSLITLFATAAMAAFFYGIVQYIWGLREGKSDKVTVGNKFMVWGLVALFVMFSVWGIVTYFQGIIGIQGRNSILIPDVQIQTGAGTNNTSPLPTSTGGGQFKQLCAANNTTYYDQATYNAQCASAGSAGGGSGPIQGTGADCTVDSECTGPGLICVNNTCQLPTNGNNFNQPVGYCPDGTAYYSASDAKFCASASCSSYSDASSCQANGCTWSNADMSCSQ